MDWTYIFNFITEIAYLLLVLGFCLTFAIFKGRQAIMNLLIGLYLALLISLEFPYYDRLIGTLEGSYIATAKLGIFAVITILTTLLCYRIMPDEFRENKFESVGKKALLAAGATILIMIFSFHVLPVTEFLTPGTPIQSLFGPEAFFFWWLLTPLVILYLV
jgi:hypothetical protein